jgi:hypothetical protein
VMYLYLSCCSHLYVLGLLYRMTLHTEPSDRDVRTRSAASRVDLGARYVTVCVVSLVARRREGKLLAVFLQPIQNRCLYRTEECYMYQYMTYKWSGTFIIKDGRFTFTFVAAVEPERDAFPTPTQRQLKHSQVLTPNLFQNILLTPRIFWEKKRKERVFK